MAGTVICGVDWRDESQVGVRVASALSRRLGARLVLVHVAPVPVAPTVSVVPGGQAELAYREERDAEDLLDEVAAAAALGDVERRVVFGDPAEQLAALAAESQAELVVVSSRGRHGLRSALLGSVSSKLVAVAPCPVVVVPPHVETA